MNDASAASLLTGARARAGTSVRWLMSFILLLAVTTAFFDRVNIAVLFNNNAFHAGIGVSDPALMGLLMTAFVFPIRRVDRGGNRRGFENLTAKPSGAIGILPGPGYCWN